MKEAIVKYLGCFSYNLDCIMEDSKNTQSGSGVQGLVLLGVGILRCPSCQPAPRKESRGRRRGRPKGAPVSASRPAGSPTTRGAAKPDVKSDRDPRPQPRPQKALFSESDQCPVHRRKRRSASARCHFRLDRGASSHGILGIESVSGQFTVHKFRKSSAVCC
ncbi:hypothetical protein SKAU_G00203060 [Synaphobranchus kaupii]|uniref:Uncharacterized protein n=1 Tax=Synaphobranchus kaupii TaxID=118154 RepID=A0A9Q1FG64_SYNKA|nr:hypothetical protein SKAU_G00203060 [Synaphobranchus kaupii]